SGRISLFLAWFSIRAIVDCAGFTSGLAVSASDLPALFNSSLNSSFAFWNSLTACPIPRASSGNFFAPNRTRIINSMTIRSGPAKFIKLASKVIATSEHQTVSPSCKAIRHPLLVFDTSSLLWEKHPTNASQLERQHQLRARLHPGRRVSSHARGQEQFPAASLE